MLNSKITTVIMIVLTGWFSLMAFGTWRAKLGVDRQVHELQAKISRLERENAELESVRLHYQDPAYLEKQARAKLNYKAQDETVVVVYQEEKKAEKSPGIVLSGWNKLKALIADWFN